GCVIALIASLLNLLPFILKDISDSINGSRLPHLPGLEAAKTIPPAFWMDYLLLSIRKNNDQGPKDEESKNPTSPTLTNALKKEGSRIPPPTTSFASNAFRLHRV